MLSLGLQNVINSVIGNEQSAFIKGRSILEGPLILNEVISWAKSTKRPLFILKADLEKAFDSLSWSFLDDMDSLENYYFT